MIALPGLLITTGRSDIARTVLLAFARYVDGGMLPNNFPDAGGTPEYNTVDAALWFFEAVRQYFVATRDTETIEKLFPALAEIIDAHLKGTRYQIHADESDGLLYAGEEGVQLTWMDGESATKSSRRESASQSKLMHFGTTCSALWPRWRRSQANLQNHFASWLTECKSVFQNSGMKG